MKIEIIMDKRGKMGSRILIDGEPVTRGILDFSVDVNASPSPIVNLKIWPEQLRISGELVDIREKNLGARIPWRREVRYALAALFVNVRKAAKEIRQVWREAHPSNHTYISASERSLF